MRSYVLEPGRYVFLIEVDSQKRPEHGKMKRRHTLLVMSRGMIGRDCFCMGLYGVFSTRAFFKNRVQVTNQQMSCS